MDKEMVEILKREFENKVLKNTCFKTIDELLQDKTSVQINAPRALIACNLAGRWKGYLEGFEKAQELI